MECTQRGPRFGPAPVPFGPIIEQADPPRAHIEAGVDRARQTDYINANEAAGHKKLVTNPRAGSP